MRYLLIFNDTGIHIAYFQLFLIGHFDFNRFYKSTYILVFLGGICQVKACRFSESSEINGSIGNASDCPFRISGNKETELSRNCRKIRDLKLKITIYLKKKIFRFN